VEFPEIFQRPEQGFDVVLSNPPWERIKLQEKEWFAVRAPEIAGAANAAVRKRMIEALQDNDPSLYADFHVAQRAAESESHFIRSSGKYPLCGRGDVNTYTIFAELARQVVSPGGRVGVIVPTGIATDDTTKYYFQAVMETGTLASLYDFENRKGIFPGVHRSYKFCLLTLRGSTPATPAPAEFVFFALGIADLLDGERRFTLSAAEIALLNPNTRTCPIFRSRRDADLTKAIYRRVPVLIKEGQPEENPWGVRFATMFHMSNDSHLFRTRPQLEQEGWRLEGNRFVRGDDVYLPLYEAKMLHQYDHRWATYEGGDTRDVTSVEKADPAFVVNPRYWMRTTDVEVRLEKKPLSWLLGFRDIARSTDERTAIFSVIPRVAVGHKAPLFFVKEDSSCAIALIGCTSSFVFDYITRQNVGGTSMTFFIVKQLPVPLPTTFRQPCAWMPNLSLAAWLLPRVLELTYTAWDLAPFARDCGYDGPPFRWDVERRFLLRAELDAAYFHLYGIAREDVAYILDTFPIVKRKELARYGEYRSQRVILEFYDGMAGGGEPHP
jgi:hypothetical protein